MSIVLSVTTLSCKSQENQMQIKVASSFIKSLMDGKLSNNEIVTSYLSISTETTESKKIVELQLNSLREYLAKEVASKDDLVFVAYKKALFEELLIGENLSKNVILIKDKNKVLFPLLFKGEKISSFSTMNKGGKKIFMLL
jgi:hypothetical protein